MKNINHSFFIIALLLFASCETDLSNYSCSNCFQNVPEEGEAILEFTINEENTAVRYFVYEGTEPGRDTLISDTTTNQMVSIYLLTEQDYCAEAIYTRNGKTIHVFDGGKIRIGELSCYEEPCYYPRDLTINLRLLSD